MPKFTVSRHIEAPIEKVWEVLDDFGGIARWSPGIKTSELTSVGPVGEGTTRNCDFVGLGAVNERIDTYLPNERMTVNLYETFKLPIEGAVADFNLASVEDGTELTLHYSYTLNRLGRVVKGTTGKQMKKGINGLADDLRVASESTATS
ncbi:MAG: SRPBCC family protein [Actinobacteria bacterium]|nr:SRPBCC family protein [Actinomycetota bacterium]